MELEVEIDIIGGVEVEDEAVDVFEWEDVEVADDVDVLEDEVQVSRDVDVGRHERNVLEGVDEAPEVLQRVLHEDFEEEVDGEEAGEGGVQDVLDGYNGSSVIGGLGEYGLFQLKSLIGISKVIS